MFYTYTARETTFDVWNAAILEIGQSTMTIYCSVTASGWKELPNLVKIMWITHRFGQMEMQN